MTTSTHPAAPAAPTQQLAGEIADRQPSYRDAELHRLMKALRATVKPHAEARRCLQAAETRLRFVLRVVETWDRTHAERAEQLIALDCLPAANSAAALVFDSTLRAQLYEQAPIGPPTEAADHDAAIEAGREVLV